MCGRYNLIPSAHAWADVGQVLGEVLAETLRSIPPMYNVAPTQRVPIVISDAQGRPALVQARWGFIPEWWEAGRPAPTNTTNARAETAAKKNMWRGAWRKSRCLIPATSWFEWFNADVGTTKPIKIPHVIERADGKEIMFAGLWSWSPPSSDGTVYPTCAIVTVASPPDIAEIHERTPVVLDPEYWRKWLDPQEQDAAAVQSMIQTGAVELFKMYTVDSTVNSGRDKRVEILEPKDWPEMTAQGHAKYSKAQLNWLRLAPAAEVQRELTNRLDAFELGTASPAAERRLWVRELMDREDADGFAALIEEIRKTLRTKAPEPKPKPKADPPPKKDSGQGSLF